MSKALLVGLGGIGRNVYLPQLLENGYEVKTLDLDTESGADWNQIEDVRGHEFDVGVVCVPNRFHGEVTMEIAPACKTVLVEKPGLSGSHAWGNVCLANPDTKIVMVKNNMYRSDYGEIFKRPHDDIAAIEICWFNKDRIPNPGTWFTNKYEAFGGVSRDLMPHLLSFAFMFFNEDLLEAEYQASCYQMWNLDNIGDSTDYGIVDKDGVYDVEDFAEIAMLVNNIPVKLRASWKEGYDKQSVTVHYKDGTSTSWDFGLCPDDAYGRMVKYVELEDREWHMKIDLFFHQVMEHYALR